MPNELGEYKKWSKFWIHPEDASGLILPNSEPEIIVEIKHDLNFVQTHNKVIKRLQEAIVDHQEMLARNGLSEQ